MLTLATLTLGALYSFVVVVIVFSFWWITYENLCISGVTKRFNFIGKVV